MDDEDLAKFVFEVERELRGRITRTIAEAYEANASGSPEPLGDTVEKIMDHFGPAVVRLNYKFGWNAVLGDLEEDELLEFYRQPSSDPLRSEQA